MVTNNKFMQAYHVGQAIRILKSGGIGIFPTDTAFGIGCRIDNEDAVRRLFKLRRRPERQATPVLVGSFEMAQEYLQPVPIEVKRQLIDKYWPGALTVVLACKSEKVPELVRGGGPNLGVRMPENEIILEIIRRVGVPVLGPSANFHGEKTPYAFEDLDPELVKQVDFVLEGRCKTKLASTVISCSLKPWQILRQGAVNIL